MEEQKEDLARMATLGTSDTSRTAPTVAPTAIDDGGSAFPLFIPSDGRCGPGYEFGMKLRDYLAAKALPVVMEKSDIQAVYVWSQWAKRVAEASYEIADAMLQARKART